MRSPILAAAMTLAAASAAPLHSQLPAAARCDSLADTERRVSACREAIRVNPDAVAAYRYLAAALDSLGRQPEAHDIIRTAIAHRPDEASLHVTLGIMQLRAKRFKEAEETFRKAISLTREDAELHGGLAAALLQQRKRCDDALAHLGTAIRLDSAAAVYRHNKGIAFLCLRRPAEAVWAFLEAERLPSYRGAPDSVGAARWLDLARASTERGEFEAAVAAFRRAAQLEPGSAEAHYELGHALSRLERHEEALSAYTRAAELSPTLPGPPFQRATALFMLKRDEDAIRMFCEVIRKEPKDHESWGVMAWSTARLGRHAEAVSYWTRALQLDRRHFKKAVMAEEEQKQYRESLAVAGAQPAAMHCGVSR
jgi:Flp pilus assembly protein TadD